MSNSKVEQCVALKFLAKLKITSTTALCLLRKAHGRECMSRTRALGLYKQLCEDQEDVGDKRSGYQSKWKTIESITMIKKNIRRSRNIRMMVDKVDDDDDEIFVKNVASSDVSSDAPKNRPNSVIDSIGADFFTLPSGSSTPRFRSKSLSLSTSDYFTSPESLSKTDGAHTFQSCVRKERSDAIDARPNIYPRQNIDVDINLINRKSTTSTVFMSVSKDAENYNMNHKNRGKCVIFNHEEFDIGFDRREGSTMDALRLQKSFGRLGFDVVIHNDLTHLEIMNEIDKLSQFNHTDNDCFCIIVLTHGLQNDLICAKDAAYKSDKIWKPFTADRCVTLAGKPKMFFFQACRGDELDSGVVLSPRNLITSETDGVTSYKIPTHADFLIAHSSVQGFYTWRNPMEGTWYIQCLCNVLDEYGTKLDLISLLTITARKVATDYASNNSVDVTMHDKKQVPSVTTMLIRSVYFSSKSNKQIISSMSTNK